MADDPRAYWNRYLANAHIDVSFAAYTKVPSAWELRDEVPAFNRMYYFVDGEGFIRLDGTTYAPKPGELYILPAGLRTSFGTEPHRTFEKHWCHFTAKVAGDLNLFDVFRAPVCVKPRDPAAVEAAFRKMYGHFPADGLTAAFRIRSALLDLLAVFLEGADGVRFQAKTSSTFGKMNTVLAYIEERIGEHMTVEELAGLAHFQRNYFIQVFKDFTGYSPIQYINRARMDKACQLLAFTGMSVSSVAEAVGLEFSYFSRMFKEYTGYTPSSYRELMPAASETTINTGT